MEPPRIKLSWVPTSRVGRVGGLQAALLDETENGLIVSHYGHNHIVKRNTKQTKRQIFYIAKNVESWL